MHVIPKEEWCDYASHLLSLEKEKHMTFHSPHPLIVPLLKRTKKYVDHAEKTVAIKSSGEWLKIHFCTLTPISASKIDARPLKSQEEMASFKFLEA